MKTTTKTNHTWFYIVADGVVTAAGERWYRVSYPHLTEGTRKEVRFGYKALRGMTDSGQPGWEDSILGDQFTEATVKEAYLLSKKCLVAGPFLKVDPDTIRAVRHDETRVVTTKVSEVPVDEL